MVEPNDTDAIELEEPGRGDDEPESGNAIWMRGLWMLVLALMFGLAETVLAVMAVVQFFWMLFAKEKNELLADFGKDLGKWMSDVAQFQTAATDEKPFPWKKWG